MKASIIMPVFMAEEFLSTAIESVLCQTYSDFELIIVNDGSSDRSAEVAMSYASLSDKIVFITQSNRGASAARNSALGVACGDIIAYLDADDKLLPDHLETRVKALKAGREFVFGPVWEMRGGKRKVFHGILEGGARDCVMPLMVAHFRNCTEYERFDPEIVFEEDLDLWRRIGARHAIYQFQSPVTAEYRVHPRGIHIMYENGGQEAVLAYRAANRRRST